MAYAPGTPRRLPGQRHPNRMSTVVTPGPHTGQQPPHGPRHRAVRRWGAVALSIVGLLSAGCSGAGGPDSATSPAVAGAGASKASSGMTEQSSLPCPAAAPAARAQLPAVSLSCLGGGPGLMLDHLPAGAYVINLWASWCEPCRREAPRLAAAAAAAGGRVQFLGVDTDDGSRPALAFLQDFGIHYPQLADPKGDVLRRLPAPGLPVTLALDSTGQVVYRRIGEVTAEQLADAVRAADPTAPVPADGGR